MDNKILNKFNNTIKIKITGKNIDRFIKRLYKNNIEILSLNNLSRNSILITINMSDYEKVNKIKSIYNIEKKSIGGTIKLKKNIYKYRFLLISLLFGYFIILILSNVIFEVQVIHSNRDIRNLVINELKKYDIKKYSFKKNFKKLNEITNKILDDNKNDLEWISIENVGTKVLVKIEERKLNKNEKSYPKQNIVAKKSGIIKKVVAKDGVIIRNINDYVKKGEVIISGEIMDTYNEKLLDTVSASGNVYAEVWYTVDMEYPLIYSKEEETGKKKEVYELEFFDKRISLFDFNKYEHSNDTYKIVLENRLLPFRLLKTLKKEVKKDDEVLLVEEALIKSMESAKNKIESRLNKDEHIIKERQLSFYQKDSKIVVEIFFSVYESIGTPSEISKERLDELKNEQKEVD